MSTTVTSTPAGLPTEFEIQAKAYALWAASGCRPGAALECWIRAKTSLRRAHEHARKISARRTARSAPAISDSHRPRFALT